MVVVKLINTVSGISSSSLHQLPNNTLQISSSANPLRHFYTLTCRPTSPTLIYLRQLHRIKTPTKPFNFSKASRSSNGVLLVKGYMEESNSVSGFANKVIGVLPLIGLFARIFSDVGGVGGDIIDFAEFRRRVGNNSLHVNDSRAFIEFQERRGRKRSKLGVPTPTIPMEARAEKAMEAIYICCFGRDPTSIKVDEKHLYIMLNAVFPSVGQPKIRRIVKDKAKRVAQGGDSDEYPEPKHVSKEAVQLQMKDLQFLKQNSES